MVSKIFNSVLGRRWKLDVLQSEGSYHSYYVRPATGDRKVSTTPFVNRLEGIDTQWLKAGSGKYLVKENRRNEKYWVHGVHEPLPPGYKNPCIPHVTGKPPQRRPSLHG